MTHSSPRRGWRSINETIPQFNRTSSGVGRMNETETFAGFAAPDANFTPTPNQFFDVIVGHYDPCVVTVVAILIRETLGWKNKHTGARKIEAALAQSDFIKHGLSKESVRKGIKTAIAAGFIVQTAAASPRDPARYALRWADMSEQDEAIAHERRALGVEPTKAGGLAAPGERQRKSKGRKADIRVLKTRVLKIRTLKNRTLTDGTLKETDSLKEIDSLKNVNVRPEGQSTLSKHKREALHELAQLTGDTHSDAGNRQLYDIAHKASCDQCWIDALEATRKRIQKSTQPLERPGAFFRSVLAKLLEEQGITVPTGTAEERAQARAAIRKGLDSG